MRKKIWRELLNEYESISNVIKLKVHEDYTVNIKSKLLSIKNRKLSKIQSRADYHHILTIIPNPNKKYNKNDFIKSI